MLEGKRRGLYQGSAGSGLVTAFVGLTSCANLWDEKATSAEHETVRKSERGLANIHVVLIRQMFWKTQTLHSMHICIFWCRTWCCFAPLGAYCGKQKLLPCQAAWVSLPSDLLNTQIKVAVYFFPFQVQYCNLESSFILNSTDTSKWQKYGSFGCFPLVALCN